MKDLYRKNKHFLVPYLLFLIIGGVIIIMMDKADLHLNVNRHHSPFSDFFFKYVTYLGDGLAILVATILLLFIKYRYALLIFTANIISSVISQFLKRMVFDDMVRPKQFFNGIAEIYLVPGEKNHMLHSFPSGHTTIAFTLYFCLALITENKYLKTLLFIISLLIGFSRVYLSQHFFIDVYAGSLIGVVVSLVVYYLLENSARLKKHSWLHCSLLKPKCNDVK